jgi:hypothetical protein
MPQLSPLPPTLNTSPTQKGSNYGAHCSTHTVLRRRRRCLCCRLADFSAAKIKADTNGSCLVSPHFFCDEKYGTPGFFMPIYFLYFFLLDFPPRPHWFFLVIWQKNLAWNRLFEAVNADLVFFVIFILLLSVLLSFIFSHIF